MRRSVPLVRAFVVAAVAAGPLLVGGPKPAGALAASVAPGCRAATPVEVICQQDRVYLEGRLQELAKLSDRYVAVMRRSGREPVLYHPARPLLNRLGNVRRLAAMGWQAPADELCRTLADAAELIRQSEDFRERYFNAIYRGG